MCSRLEKTLLIATYFAVAILLAIKPYDRGVWALENSVPFLEGLALMAYYHWRGVELTRLSNYLVLIHLIIQMIGGHYTYEHVPLFDVFKEKFGWTRNHYDRLGHFALGFCLYVPIREICLRRTPLRESKAWASFFAFTTITAIAGLWEVWEWLVAITASHDASQFYLGAQGDPWDAQKDILLAPVGTVFSWFILSRWHDRMLGRSTKA